MAQAQGTLTFSFQLDKLTHNSPQCAIWIEDASGNYIETVFVTNFVGRNAGGHPSGNNRKSALPVWAYKRGVVDNSGSTPSYYPPRYNVASYPADIDAVTGATTINLSTHTFTLNGYSSGIYKCYIEVNQSWDYTSDFTSSVNANGQPSALWYVDINVSGSTDEDQILDYVGYGSHTGPDGDINLPDNKITTAYNLLKTQGSGASAYKFKVNFTPDNNTGVEIDAVTNGNRCGPGTVTLGASASQNTAQINWYASQASTSSLATGASYTTPTISSTTTYYVDATYGGNTSDRVAVTATIKPIPAINGTTNDSRTDEGVVNLGASSDIGTISWYSAKTGGNSIHTGNTYSPNISSTTTFYVEATKDGCTSLSRTAVTGTISTLPVISNTTGGSRCGEGEVTLRASASPNTAKINWYASQASTSSLATGASYTTPAISSTTTYYVDATYGGNTSDRAAVTAAIKPIPTIISAYDIDACTGATAFVKAEASDGGTVNWYTSDNTSETAIETGPEYVIVDITDNSIYYVDATLNGCTTESRTPITITVKPNPVVNSTKGAFREDAGEVTITATANQGDVLWYDAETDGNLLHTGTSYTTTISSSTVFYVEASYDGCNSSRTPVYCVIDVISSTGLLQAENSTISVYPNPGFDFITIALDTDQQIEELTILDQTGKIINQYKNLSSGSSINISAYDPGLYYFKVTLKDKTLVNKFIKQQ